MDWVYKRLVSFPSHWSSAIAKEVIEKKKEPFVIASAVSTSGPSHIGTVCEFLYPSALTKYLRDGGYSVDFVFIGDIMDALDSIPQSLTKYSFLRKHLGKPICDVPDPYKCCESYGVHFLNEVSNLMDRMEVSCRILKANDLVRSGIYDRYIRIFYEKIYQIKKIAKETAEMSNVKDLPDWVDIIMPICENCGKVATTKALSFDGDTFQYADIKDLGYIKGCNYKGEMKISDHQYKLFWRLDWPSRQDFLKVSVELAGVDHHTRGGSWDTSVAVHREIFGKKPPIGRKYGFVLLHGKKYSKSKGTGLSVKELIGLVPPPLIKYKLFRPDIGENKEFDPSGHSLINLYDEFQRAANLYKGDKKLHKGEIKMVLAYSLSVNKKQWSVDFTDVLINYQIYKNWTKVADKMGDKESVYYLKKYVENWIDQEYLPEEFVFEFKPKKINVLNEEMAIFASELNNTMTGEDIHNLVYAVAKETGNRVPKLFRALYCSLIAKNHGPRFGRLIVALGIINVKESLTRNYKT